MSTGKALVPFAVIALLAACGGGGGGDGGSSAPSQASSSSSSSGGASSSSSSSSSSGGGSSSSSSSSSSGGATSANDIQAFAYIYTALRAWDSINQLGPIVQGKNSCDLNGSSIMSITVDSTIYIVNSCRTSYDLGDTFSGNLASWASVVDIINTSLSNATIHVTTGYAAFNTSSKSGSTVTASTTLQPSETFTVAVKKYTFSALSSFSAAKTLEGGVLTTNVSQFSSGTGSLSVAGNPLSYSFQATKPISWQGVGTPISGEISFTQATGGAATVVDFQSDGSIVFSGASSSTKRWTDADIQAALVAAKQ